jgi:opacity protein-like surface antigen
MLVKLKSHLKPFACLVSIVVNVLLNLLFKLTLMKRIAFVIISVLIAQVVIAQPLRIHIMGGFANYTGDLQTKRFTLDQARGVVTAGATFNITDKFALRSEYSFAKLGADDKRSSSEVLRNRNLNFQSVIQELSLMGEYDILNTNYHKLTPYVFGGLGVYRFSPFTFTESNEKVFLQGLSTEGQGFLAGRKIYKKTKFNVPLGGGVKYALSEDVHVGLELGLRVLTTDYLDDVSATYVDENLLLSQKGPLAVQLAYRGDELKPPAGSYPAGLTARGNSKINDFYYFGQFRISFRMNWFEKGDRSSGTNGRKSLDCPTKL